MKLRVALGVTAAWIVAGIVWGAQNALGASLRSDPLALSAAVRTALINVLPWVPVTLTVIALTVRYPVTRRDWRRTLWPHLLAFPLVTYGANILVVLGFWVSSGAFQDLGTLLRQGAFWAGLRIHVSALLYIAIAVATRGVLYYRETQARELRLARLEGQLATARLQALNAQIRPHFLFNTLHTIGQLWRSGRSDEADALLDHLGALFQEVQSQTNRSAVPLEQELGTVEKYLAIEKVRFRDRLRVEIEASPAALRVEVPPLLLQPLVENAIRHGVSPRSDAGHLRIAASVDAGTLRLTVDDDGPGPASPSPTPGSGTGLSNTRDRLGQMYGGRAVLVCEERPGGGCRTRVEIPVDASVGGPVAPAAESRP